MQRFVSSIGVGILSVLVYGLAVYAAGPADPASIRSWPPDTNPYTRQAVPEDYAPRGKEAIPPGVSTESGESDITSGAPGVFPFVFLHDVVVSNTDPTLTLNDMDNDGETSIAVNPLFPLEIVITAGFSYWGTNSVLWHTRNGGITWTRRLTVPVPPGQPRAFGCPCDQTIDFGRFNQLSGTFLIGTPNPVTPDPTDLEGDVVTGTTLDRTNPDGWFWRVINGVTQPTNENVASSIGAADQPWLLVNRDPSRALQDNVYVAYDDFGNGDGIDGPDMRIAVSYGAIPPNFTVDNQSGNSLGAINPGHRLAEDKRRGLVYSLFQRHVDDGADDSKNIDYMLNRSTDGGQSWSLNGSTTGTIVANADSTQPQPKFCTVNALLGGVLHAAVDPRSGDLFYVYGNRDPNTDNNRLALRRIVDDGAGGVQIGEERFITGQVQAALPSVAVADNGTVGIFYYTCDGTSMTGFPVFTAHLALTDDLGETFTDLSLLTFLSSATDNGQPRQRVLGDYMQMKPLGNTFYGAFTGNGVAFGRPFANHDPIFFHATVR